MKANLKKHGYVLEIIFSRIHIIKTKLIIKVMLCFGGSFLIDCVYLSLDSLPQRYAIVTTYHQIS